MNRHRFDKLLRHSSDFGSYCRAAGLSTQTLCGGAVQLLAPKFERGNLRHTVTFNIEEVRGSFILPEVDDDLLPLC